MVLESLITAFKGLCATFAVRVVLQLGDGELEVLDLGVEIERAGFGAGGALVRLDQQRLQRSDIIGKLGRIEGHARNDSCFAADLDR